MSARTFVAVFVSALSATVACAGGLRACLHAEAWPGPVGAAPPAQPAAPAASMPALAIDVERPHGAHPRLLLTPDRLAALRALRDSGSPAWRRLAERCDEDVRQTVDAGYEAWDWANAALDLALCAAVSARPEYTHAALQYFRAILDDRSKVGDGAGGDEVVHHDDGYSIRTRGCFGALAYDWLHDAPAMSGELRKHAVDRFAAWNEWFGESGYSRDQPIANYYIGWFGSVAFAGIAAQGDDPRATALLHAAQRMYASDIVPVFGQKLAGGDFPEGWQYGDMVGAILAIFADAESHPGSARSPFDELPWLRQTLAFRAHALWPDGKHMLDTGDWSEKPAVAPTHTLLALAAVLPPTDEASRRARALARLARATRAAKSGTGSRPSARIPPAPQTIRAARRRATSREARRPSRRAPTGLRRVSGSPSRARPRSPPIASTSTRGTSKSLRGGDALVIDAGGYGSYSSLSHNVIAVDDRKDNDKYAPNQGLWSDGAAIVRHEDDGRFVYALADYASAYDPRGYPENHPTRSVSRAEREGVFSRSPVPAFGAEAARDVIYDRITLAKASYAATFLLHGAGAPLVQGEAVRFGAGRSVAFATTLLPAGATPVVVPEPTSLGEGPYYANDPPEGTRSVRVEVRSKLGELERRFLHAFVVGGDGAPAPAPSRIEGEGVDGVAIEDEAYVFQRARALEGAARVASFEYRAPGAATRHVVASLAPHARYAVAAQREGGEGGTCRVTIAPGEGTVASDAGVVVLELAPGCALRPPSSAPHPVAGGAP